jgi:hypothetical protein
MSKYEEFRTLKQQIAQETDAEIAFGRFLEEAGVDCDAFMRHWQINQSQFNQISHYLYGLTEDVSTLPPALAVLLTAARRHNLAAA